MEAQNYAKTGWHMAPQLVAVGGTGHCQENHMLTRDHHCPIDTVDMHFEAEGTEHNHIC